MNDNKISAFVVVRNEFNRINLCLASLFGEVDEIVLIDDASNGDECLFNLYEYWGYIAEFHGIKFNFKALTKNKGYHSLHYPMVLEMASYPWLFQLDGDEVLRTPCRGYLKRMTSVNKPVVDGRLEGFVGFRGKLINYYQSGLEFETGALEPKTRLYHRSFGHFPTRPGSEWVVDSGEVADADYVIDHVRTEKERLADAKRYYRGNLRFYKEAKEKGNSEDMEHFSTLFERQCELYGWPFKTIEECIEKGEPNV